MRRPDLSIVVLALVLAGPVSAQATSVPDSLVARVQRLVNAGNRDAARALADSALVVRTQGTLAYGEALFARGWATSDAAAAEKDYVRLAVEYPFSPRVEDALVMVAQLRYARGERAGARRQYERLASEFPDSPHSARHNYWAGRIGLEDGDIEQGCRFLFVASEKTPKGEIELRNQVEYLRSRCMMPSGPAPTPPRDSTRDSPRDTTRTIPRDSTPIGPRPVPTPPVVRTQTEYSVQVAAYTRRREADQMASRLRTRGFQVRVAHLPGTNSPFKVRVGRYGSRADAVAAQQRMRRQSRLTGIVVEAEPR